VEEGFRDKLIHCCEAMDSILARGESALFYRAHIRDYLIREIMFKKNSIELTGVCNAIKYCPWCATKLPKSLGSIREAILEKEYNITESWNIGQKKLIPPEFQTDEWWKKRGL
jgi:Domain of unknown function (DUF6980)